MPSTTSGEDCHAPEHLALQHPLLLEVADVLRRDLLERRIALARVGAGVRQPVVRLVAGANDALGGDGLRGGAGGEQPAEDCDGIASGESGGAIMIKAPSAKRDTR